MGGEFSGERICYMYGWVLLLSTWNYQTLLICYSVHFSRSVVSTLCNPMNRRKPGLPVHHQLPEFTQTHVHRVSDAIQLSHHLSSPYAPDPSPSQYQGLCQWVNSSHHVAKVLEFQLQHQSFQWDSGLISFMKSWQIDGGKNGTCNRLYFLGLQKHCRWWLQPWN